MSISTHVLDAVSGAPAAAMGITLLDADGAVLDRGCTDGDGRIAALGGDQPAGVYRLRFDTAEYFAAQGTAGFYPEVVIAFHVTDASAKHHVPLLLSPSAYSTYRGS